MPLSKYASPNANLLSPNWIMVQLSLLTWTQCGAVHDHGAGICVFDEQELALGNLESIASYCIR